MGAVRGGEPMGETLVGLRGEDERREEEARRREHWVAAGRTGGMRADGGRRELRGHAQ